MQSESGEQDARTGFFLGEHHVSREAMQERVLKAAAALASLRPQRGDSIALLLRNDLAFLEASLATQHLGCNPVPINWHFAPDEVAYILNDIGARILIGHADLLDAVRAYIPAGMTVVSVVTPREIAAAYGLRWPQPSHEGDVSWESLVEASPPSTDAPIPSGGSVIYTSGTTGRPKGVVRVPPTPEQQALIREMRSRVYGMRPGMHTAVTAPLYHSGPNNFALGAAPLSDAFVIMPRFDPLGLLEIIERYRITHLFVVPIMFVRLLKLPAEIRKRYDISSLEFVVHAGAPCPSGVKREMIEWWGPVIWEFYGNTEAGAVVLVDSHTWLANPGTVGRPIDGSTVKIFGDDGREVPAGESGEIFMRIGFLPDFTYRGREDERRVIERDGLITGGDIGFFDEHGYLHICDRKRDMVISGGVNIYPAEIEARLLEIGEVADCAVFGVPDPEYGEALMACVQPQPGARIDEREIRQSLRGVLASYKIPKVIEFRNELPRDENGKIRKRLIRDLYWRETGRAV